MGQSISMQLTRNLSIAPALQKSLQLLQMNALEFEQEIRQALDSNPLLELDEAVDTLSRTAEDGTDAAGVLDPDFEHDGGFDGGLDLDGDFNLDGPNPGGPDLDSAVEADRFREEAPFAEDQVVAQQVEAATDEFNEPLSDWSAATQNTASGDGISALDLTPSHGSLREHLMRQLGSLRVDRVEQWLCCLVIDSLDPAGYLRESLEDLTKLALDTAKREKLGFGRGAIDCDTLRTAITRVQSFEPAGIAARSIEECLHLQLRDVPEANAGRELAVVIVNEHLPALARNDFRCIVDATNASETGLSAAMKLIRSLDPKPGLAHGRDRVVFAVPEVIVKKVKGVWIAGLHPAATPKVRINTVYADIVARNEGGQCNGLSAQLQEARWMMRSIEQRASTIERTADAIVARQQAFFEHGDIGLQPLKLADIAADVGIHESTVSRVVNSKYLQCPAGLMPMRKFFTSHVETSAGNACSATAVKAMIRQLVDGEAPGDPVSDHRLAKLLAQRGIRIARRTVTKYRDAIGIEAADIRKHLGQPAGGSPMPPTRSSRVPSSRSRAQPLSHSAAA